MHTFGRLPEAEKLGDFVHAIARFDAAVGSLRWLAARLIEQKRTIKRRDAPGACRRS